MGQFTVKRYQSEKKTTDDGWSHRQIELIAETDRSGYEPIVLKEDSLTDFSIVGEFIAVLG